MKTKAHGQNVNKSMCVCDGIVEAEKNSPMDKTQCRTNFLLIYIDKPGLVYTNINILSELLLCILTSFRAQHPKAGRNTQQTLLGGNY